METVFVAQKIANKRKKMQLLENQYGVNSKIILTPIDGTKPKSQSEIVQLLSKDLSSHTKP
jgi:hypothetical protein